jgi:hypothetical protein
MEFEHNKRCLLIAPLTFYTFHTKLVTSLNSIGYSVDLFNEECPNCVVGKIIAKLYLSFSRRLTLLALQRHLYENPSYDLVLIVKGRGVGEAALNLLKLHAKRVIGYNWDSFNYNPSALDWYKLTDKFATFDVVDSKKYNIPLVHLFSGVFAQSPSKQPIFDVSVVMRVHSDRLVYVDRVLKAIKGQPVFVYLYTGSLLTFIPIALTAPIVTLRLWRYIFFNPLSYDVAMKCISNSRATIDYAHPLQSGITVRCFEALSMGVPVITNNPNVEKAGVFPGGSIKTFPLDGSFERLPGVISSFDGLTIKPILRTTDDFIFDLLEESSTNKMKGV